MIGFRISHGFEVKEEHKINGRVLAINFYTVLFLKMIKNFTIRVLVQFDDWRYNDYILN